MNGRQNFPVPPRVKNHTLIFDLLEISDKKKSFFCQKTDMYREAAQTVRFYNKDTKKNPWKGENSYEVRIYYGNLRWYEF